MRLDRPRLAPLDRAQIDPELAARFGDGPVLNIFRTLAHHPKLLRRWLVFGSHVLGKSSLSPRDREILILRVGYLCQAGYEWEHHVAIAKDAGLSDDDIARIAHPDAPGFRDAQRALLRAADELHADQFVGEATWAALTEHYDTEQILDLIFTVGQYHLVSMALNTLGVQLEEGVSSLPRR